MGSQSPLPPAPPQLYQRVRNHFPYFDPHRANPVFFENAGGSQLPNTVIEAVREHMVEHYVQLGAGYELSDRATSTVDAAHDVIKTFLNVGGSGEVVLGGSTSQLLATIADTYRRSGTIGPGDEVIIHVACHEANIGPWVRLAADTGATVKWWGVNPKPPNESSFEELEGLLPERTKIVSVTHVSNLLGEILDVREVVEIVRNSPAGARAKVVVDGVAYAPHRLADVTDWGVDWYAFSVYKTWGPHVAALYGSHVAFQEVEDFGPNHDWIDGSDVPYKFELGGPSHEACAGILGLAQYITLVAREMEFLEGSVGGDVTVSGASEGEYRANASSGYASAQDTGQRVPDESCLSVLGDRFEPTGAHLADVSPKPAVGKVGPGAKRALLKRSDVETFYRAVVWLEQSPQEKLLTYLLTDPDVTVIGPATWQPDVRVPTFSFIHVSRTSADVTRGLQKAGFAMRHGHMYARRLVESLSIGNVDDGVVRISLVHYNTPDEMDRLISTLKELLHPDHV